MRLAMLLSLVSLVYFIIAFKFLIPAIQDPERPFSLFTFSSLGENPSEALIFMVSHPIETFKLFFANTTGEAIFENVKSEFYFVYL
jgi:hypothetical protein